MPMMRTTGRLLAAYADTEPWSDDHNEAQSCLDVEERLAWGGRIYQGLLDLEARTQARAMRQPTPEAAHLLDLMPEFYRLWAEFSDHHLGLAREFVEQGHEVDGLDEFAATVEEVRCLLDNLGLEPQIRPIEELIAGLKPTNPNPGRYGA